MSIAALERSIKKAVIPVSNVKVEFYSLTKGEKAAATTIVVLAALTAIVGIVLLLGVGSISTPAAWAMVGSGAGVALLVLIPLVIRHHRFKRVELQERLSSDFPIATVGGGFRLLREKSGNTFDTIRNGLFFIQYTTRVIYVYERDKNEERYRYIIGRTKNVAQDIQPTFATANSLSVSIKNFPIFYDFNQYSLYSIVPVE